MTDPRTRRLQADFEKVSKLISESGGTLSLIKTENNPPTKYVIEYKCPSLYRASDGQLLIRDQHKVEITLGLNYPIERPSARMLTPVFNPHVFLNNSICLGAVWSPAETLDVLVLRIGALLQLDPRVLDARSPANIDANLWVQRNRSKIPLGNETFRAAQPSRPRIEWS